MRWEWDEIWAPAPAPNPFRPHRSFVLTKKHSSYPKTKERLPKEPSAPSMLEKKTVWC